MSRNEYTTKSASGKEILIIKYYNEMYKGRSLYFVFLSVIPSLALTFKIQLKLIFINSLCELRFHILQHIFLVQRFFF